MKKIINDPAQYTDDMLQGIYRAHGDQVGYVNGDLRCYCTKKKIPGKVAIITGGGTGHLPLFLGYVGENLLDGCAVGSVFQSPSAEQIYEISKAVEAGAGVLYLYGNYTGDIMNFDMAAEMCDMDDIKTASIVGADDVNSNADVNARRGVAGIFFMYKCAGAKAAQMGTLDEVLAAAQKAKDNTPHRGLCPDPLRHPGDRPRQLHPGGERDGHGHGHPRGARRVERPREDRRRAGRGVFEHPAGRHARGGGGGGGPAHQRPGRHLCRGAIHPVQQRVQAAGGQGHPHLPHLCGQSLPPPWRWRGPPSLS